MFNLFKKKSGNPVSDLFSTVTTNQRKSIINLFILVASIDQDLTKGVNKKEFDYIDFYILIIDLKSECSSRLESFGEKGIIEDLKNLNSKQKEFLVVMVYELMCVDGEPIPYGVESAYFEHLFSRIGVSTKLMVETIKSEVSHFEQMLNLTGVSSKLMIDTINNNK